MAKSKGPTFDQIGASHRNDEGAREVEQRSFVVHNEGLEAPSSRVLYFDCPFCGDEVKAYLWSLCGGGKRCDCGAMASSRGQAFHFKDVEHRRQGEKPDYVTITSGMRGIFAVYLKWNPEHGGFYEPWNTGETCRSRDEAIGYAKAWAEAEGVEYVAA